jgi:hypothetical protein
MTGHFTSYQTRTNHELATVHDRRVVPVDIDEIGANVDRAGHVVGQPDIILALIALFVDMVPVRLPRGSSLAV